MKPTWKDFESVADRLLESEDPRQRAKGRFIREVYIPFGHWWEREQKDLGIVDTMGLAVEGLEIIYESGPGRVAELAAAVVGDAGTS